VWRDSETEERIYGDIVTLEWQFIRMIRSDEYHTLVGKIAARSSVSKEVWFVVEALGDMVFRLGDGDTYEC
jgi:hypothetical protein